MHAARQEHLTPSECLRLMFPAALAPQTGAGLKETLMDRLLKAAGRQSGY